MENKYKQEIDDIDGIFQVETGKKREHGNTKKKAEVYFSLFFMSAFFAIHYLKREKKSFHESLLKRNAML